jgi:hypothetical protein
VRADPSDDSDVSTNRVSVKRAWPLQSYCSARKCASEAEDSITTDCVRRAPRTEIGGSGSTIAEKDLYRTTFKADEHHGVPSRHKENLWRKAMKRWLIGGALAWLFCLLVTVAFPSAGTGNTARNSRVSIASVAGVRVAFADNGKYPPPTPIPYHSPYPTPYHPTATPTPHHTPVPTATQTPLRHKPPEPSATRTPRHHRSDHDD